MLLENDGDGSFAYPQHMSWLRNKTIIFLLHTLNFMLMPECSVEPQISHLVYFTPCEELVPKRHFWQINVKCANGQFQLFWGPKICAQISRIYISMCEESVPIRLICEDLVRFLSDVKNLYFIFTNVKKSYQFLTHVKKWYGT